MQSSAWIGIVAMVGPGACAADQSQSAPDAPPTPDGRTPPASAGHDLVYHDGLGVVLLVNAGLGGAASPPGDQPSRIWAWSGERWSVLDSAGPPIRNLGGLRTTRRATCW